MAPVWLRANVDDRAVHAATACKRTLAAHHVLLNVYPKRSTYCSEISEYDRAHLCVDFILLRRLAHGGSVHTMLLKSVPKDYPASQNRNKGPGKIRMSAVSLVVYVARVRDWS
jgi:hypothetical protein